MLSVEREDERETARDGLVRGNVLFSAGGCLNSECQLAIPPPRGEGEQRTDQICALAIKQLTTAGGPHAGARSSFHGVPDRQQRDARAPAAAPTAARRTPAPPRQTSSRHPLADERTQPENSSRSPVRLISPPGLGPAGRWDTVAVTRDPPRHHGIPNLAMTQQLLLGAGKDDRVRSCCVHLEDNPSEAPMLCGR